MKSSTTCDQFAYYRLKFFLFFSFTMLFYDLFIKKHSINWFSVLKIIGETVPYLQMR